MSNLLTIQQGYYTFDVNGANGKMFKTNHQFIYFGTTTLSKSCCGTMTAFIVVCNGFTYYIPDTVGVPTTVVIPKHDQSFPRRFYRVFLQNQEHHSYREINNQCMNCNGQIPHGDYSNNNQTPGYKIPDLVPNNSQE